MSFISSANGRSFDVNTILTGSALTDFPVLTDEFGNVLVGI